MPWAIFSSKKNKLKSIHYVLCSTFLSEFNQYQGGSHYTLILIGKKRKEGSEGGVRKAGVARLSIF